MNFLVQEWYKYLDFSQEFQPALTSGSEICRGKKSQVEALYLDLDSRSGLLRGGDVFVIVLLHGYSKWME